MENLRALSKLREIVIAEAVELFEGDKAAAEQWLSTPVRGLGQKTPNELLTSEEGIEQVRTLIGRLEHGIIT
ncbi:MAG: antitoxin Xre/MbcA/ParS toxin-binding domain-containing protein [Marinobacter sp.]|jgi:putative toxin-antitoxin system antitoxin component (TIGR02293 family)|uniref:antitoxin Xre/MbcA/ParS toxin-binding domain-containing protein n=1 Tax=Marinobacter sp. TaxID=50741 RepID=UPI0032D9112B